MIKGYCAIVGDIIHEGHIKFLRTSKANCDWLVVGIMTDEIVEKYKGKKPAMNLLERMQVIQSIKYVDEIIFQPTFSFSNLNTVNPNVVFDSIDHRNSRTIPGEYHRMYIKRCANISSTEIKERISESRKNRKK